MAILLTDDLGRPIPQMLDLSSSSFVPLLGVRGAMNIAIQDIIPKSATMNTNTEKVLPVQLIGLDGMPASILEVRINKSNRRVVVTSGQTIQNTNGRDGLFIATRGISAVTVRTTLGGESINIFSQTFTDSVNAGNSILLTNLPTSFELTYVGTGTAVLEMYCD